MSYNRYEKDGGGVAGLVAYLIVIVVFAMFASMGACGVHEERFQNTMKQQGYKKATQGGYDFFECGVGDVWVSSFTALRDADPVTGTVCCGIFKGCTIRWP